MNLLEFLNRFFGRENTNTSKDVAKERLRLVLVHDRVNLSPQVVEALKEDLITVIKKYMEIDQSSLEVSLNNSDGTVALVANIPILGVKKDAV